MRVSLAVLLLVAMGVAVKGSDCPNGEDTLLTYNTALTPTIPGFEDRRDRIPAAVATEAANADFLCFQELWYEEDVRGVLEAVEDDFPYHYSYLHYDVSDMTGHRRRRHSDDPPCGKWKMLLLSACLAYNCLGAEDARACMTTECESRLFDMSRDCLSCISVSYTGFTEVMDQCVFSFFGSNNRFNSPGLVVASRKPMTAEYVSFNPSTKVLLERGYIKAKVENGAPFLCSHLTSVSLNTYYEAKLPYSSYTEQQQAEIQDLENKFSGTPHVLMGDLNTGPGRSGEGDENLIAEAPDNYNMLVSDMGYDNPYLDGDGRCTFCESNLVVQTRGLTGNKVIDHILVKDLGNDSSSAQTTVQASALSITDCLLCSECWMTQPLDSYLTIMGYELACAVPDGDVSLVVLEQLEQNGGKAHIIVTLVLSTSRQIPFYSSSPA
ncbi:hypothetical protein BaRGS_00009573 [Batillaria attramentaria]|uniref:Endonuclease/exonuclease/phosphatase domain-containing protein n=1 Tax=Batillaria attramentaria TaxID=370345 RepID=A0ABD0LIR5_9CAEN